MKNSLKGHRSPAIEELFRKAEAQAGSLNSDGYPVTRDVEADAGVSDDYLLDCALREAERLALRRRLLPGDILCDRGWLVMLDLFAFGTEPKPLELGQICERWGLSEATAVRQIAALIGSGLVSRQPSRHGGHEVILNLTENGSSIVRKILSSTPAGA